MLAPSHLKLLGGNVFGASDFGQVVAAAEGKKMPSNLQRLKIDVGVFEMQQGDVSGNRIVDDVLWAEIIVAEDQARLHIRMLMRPCRRRRKMQDPQLEKE